MAFPAEEYDGVAFAALADVPDPVCGWFPAGPEVLVADESLAGGASFEEVFEEDVFFYYGHSFILSRFWGMRGYAATRSKYTGVSVVVFSFHSQFFLVPLSPGS